MVYGLAIGVHVISCLILIVVILLQAGRGGGLSDTFGGGDSGQTIFGTKISVFLTKATVVAACLFLITSLLLGIMTSRRGRSLVEMERRKTLALPGTIPIPKNLTEQSEEVEVTDKEDLPLAKPDKKPTE